MKKKHLLSVLLLLSSASSVQAASRFEIPDLKQVLQGIKGDFIIYDFAVDSLGIKLSLAADGKGELVDYNGSSPILWSLGGDTLKISVLQPPIYKGFEYLLDEKGELREYEVEQGLKSLSLKFKKLEGLSSIIWTLQSEELKHFPQNPERPDAISTIALGEAKLMPRSKLQALRPGEGSTLLVSLPNYTLSPDTGAEFLPVLVRLDANNVATILENSPLGLDRLFWTLEDGSLKLADGRGYSVSYRTYKDQKIAYRSYTESNQNGVRSVDEAEIIKVDSEKRAAGFQIQSNIFQGCWKALQAEYCFQKDGLFTFKSRDQDPTQISTGYGIWSLEDGKLVGKRYQKIQDNFPLETLAELKACEKQLSEADGSEPTCRLSQVRSYELFNEDSQTIGVYRILGLPGSYESKLAHTFRR